MAKLNQIIAVEKGVKSKTQQDLAAAHHGLQKPALLAGISRTYQPKDEEGEQLPPESTRVQVKAEDVLRDTAATLTRLFDVTATKDWANCDARADVTVDGRVLLSGVPVVLSALPGEAARGHSTPSCGSCPSWTPPSPGRWTRRPTAWKTEPVRTVRTKKVPRNHVKAEATEQAPGAGRGVLRGHSGRLLDDGEVLRRAARPGASTNCWTASRSCSRRSSSPARRPTAWRSPTSGWATWSSATCSGSVDGIPGRRRAAGVREERKLKLKLVVMTRFQWGLDKPSEHSVTRGDRPPRGSSWECSPQLPADCPGRDKSQTLAPDISIRRRSPDRTGAGPVVEMPVQVRPAQLDVRWSKGRTRRHHD